MTITATIAQGGELTERRIADGVSLLSRRTRPRIRRRQLPSWAQVYLSYAQASNSLRIIIAVLSAVLIVVWWLLRKVNTKPVKTAEIELGLSDLIVALEETLRRLHQADADERKRRSVGSKSVATLGTLHGGSELTSMMIAEQLLARADLSMSSALRKD